MAFKTLWTAIGALNLERKKVGSCYCKNGERMERRMFRDVMP
jgi:hypothetical protein